MFSYFKKLIFGSPITEPAKVTAAEPAKVTAAKIPERERFQVKERVIEVTFEIDSQFWESLAEPPFAKPEGEVPIQIELIGPAGDSECPFVEVISSISGPDGETWALKSYCPCLEFIRLPDLQSARYWDNLSEAEKNLFFSQSLVLNPGHFDDSREHYNLQIENDNWLVAAKYLGGHLDITWDDKSQTFFVRVENLIARSKNGDDSITDIPPFVHNLPAGKVSPLYSPKNHFNQMDTYWDDVVQNWSFYKAD